MDKEDADQADRPANVVGIGAKPVCGGGSRERYPIEWKECCRDIYRAYQRHLTQKLGTNVAWQRIRNMVMRDMDIYRDGRLIEKDSGLTRQDIEHWINAPEANIGDQKFRYLDRYLHLELLDPDSAFCEAAQRVIAFREAELHRNLHALYVGPRHRVRDDVYAASDAFAGKLYVVDEPASQDENFRTALYIKPSEDTKYAVVGFYFKFTPDNAADIITHAYRYFGYLLPLSLAVSHTGNRTAYGVLKLFDRSLLSTKEAIFHNAAHCFLNEASLSLSVAEIEASTQPFRPVTKAKADKSAVHDLMTLTDPQLAPSYAMTADRLVGLEIDEDQRNLLNSLCDEYLLW